MGRISIVWGCHSRKGAMKDPFLGIWKNERGKPPSVQGSHRPACAAFPEWSRSFRCQGHRGFHQSAGCKGHKHLGWRKGFQCGDPFARPGVSMAFFLPKKERNTACLALVNAPVQRLLRHGDGDEQHGQQEGKAFHVLEGVLLRGKLGKPTSGHRNGASHHHMFTRTKALSLVPLFGASRRVGHAGTSVECFSLGLWLIQVFCQIKLQNTLHHDC